MAAATDLPAHAGITISLHGLGKRFNREWIFRNFHGVFSPGHTYAITGPNGSGKSTFLQVLWGQVPASKGTVHYHRAAAEIPTEEWYRHLAIATPYLDLIDEFTLREMVRFHFRLKKIRPAVTVEDLPDIMYLGSAKNKPLGNFSSGMKQRVKLALAFYTMADVYFLDEPSTNLDQQAFDWYQQERRQLPPQSTIFIASNDPSEYAGTAEVVNILDFKK